MENPEEVATRRTKKKKTKAKQSTKWAGHHYAQANTNSVNKTWALLQTTGGKDDLNVVCMLKS
jgi:hypothetical protein